LNEMEILCLGERRTKLIGNLHPKPKTVSKLNVEVTMGQFSAGPINKAVQFER